MTRHRVVAIGASAGGVEALSNMFAGLTPGLPQSFLVVLHMPTGLPSALPSILDRVGPLPAVSAQHGMVVEPATIYVAVPDRHLLLDGDRLAVTDGPTENRHRPSIDALFRSVALHAGAQDPADAAFGSLPANAIERVGADHIVTAAGVADVIRGLARTAVKESTMRPDRMLEVENHIAKGSAFADPIDSENVGPPSNYVCPDCHGGLMWTGDRSFRCRIGHAWSADALLHARSSEIDVALGMAVRSLQEKAELADSLAGKMSAGVLQDRYRRTAQESRHAATVIRQRLSDLLYTDGDNDVSTSAVAADIQPGGRTS